MIKAKVFYSNEIPGEAKLALQRIEPIILDGYPSRVRRELIRQQTNNSQ
jgi:hypothetical protein